MILHCTVHDLRNSDRIGRVEGKSDTCQRHVLSASASRHVGTHTRLVACARGGAHLQLQLCVHTTFVQSILCTYLEHYRGLMLV